MRQEASVLSRLSSDLTAIHEDIGFFSAPLDEVHSVLADVQTLLEEPHSFNQKLGEVLNVTVALESASRAAEWIPEVGTGAKSAATMLDGVNTFIREARSALGDIDTSLKPVQAWTRNVQTPVDKAWSAIGGLDGKVEASANVAARLDRHYHGDPPTNVRDCADKLHGPIHDVTVAMNDAKDFANRELTRIERPLRTAMNELNRVANLADLIDRVYADLAGLRSVVARVSAAIKKASRYSAKEIESAISWAGRTFAPETYRRVKGMLDEVQAEIDRLRKKLVDFAFGPVKDLLEDARDQIREKLSSLPAVKALEDAFAKVDDAVRRIEDAFDSLPDACADLFAGRTLSTGAC